MEILVSTSAEFTPAQMKKLVKDAKITVLRVTTKPGVLIKPGATIPAGLRVIGKSILTITDVETNTKGVLKSVTLSGRGVVKAAALQKLLEAPVPKKTDRIGTESMRFSTASDLASAGIAVTKQTAAQKAANKPLADSLQDLDRQIQVLTAKREAIQAQLDKQAAADAKAASKLKQDSLSAKGVYFSAEVTTGKGLKKTAKPTLAAARKAPVSLSSQGSIYAVNGDRKERVMTFASTDPITGRSIKGKTWFFVSEKMRAKYA